MSKYVNINITNNSVNNSVSNKNFTNYFLIFLYQICLYFKLSGHLSLMIQAIKK